ncbi:MAG: flavin reductase [Alphaproteobacteria bacterium]|nr:flavin reductase [Alphaproteobacteria bacterium]HCP00562.1 flavin reductase [Rhodospirillaceae bacterium]
MFFNPLEVGMKPDPFKYTVYNALVVPRPIGWISTISADGVVNLAPFSFFNALSGDPPCVMYCPNAVKPGTEEKKDSYTNVQETDEFVFNMCTWSLRNEMIATAEHAPSSVDEMAIAGLEAAECHNVKPPRVKASPVALECKHLQTIDLPPGIASQSHMIIGSVVGIHINDALIKDGMVDMEKMDMIARLGYLDYAKIEPENIIALKRPDKGTYAQPDADRND